MPHPHYISKKGSQLGLTLVELLIAMVLGLLLSAAVISSYLTSKQTYNTTHGINLIQENARFSMHFLSKALRNAGNLGCINRVRNKLNSSSFYDLDEPITGYEFTGTGAADTPTLSNTATLATTGWNQTLPAAIAGNVISGSDVLALKTVERLDIVLDGTSGTNVTNSTTLTVLSPNSHGLSNNSILLAGDCVQSELFKHSGSSSELVAPTGTGSGDNKNLGTAVWGREYGRDSKVYQVNQTYYYVGLRSGSTTPSLFRLVDDLNASTTETAEELVEGIETLQIFYGVDSDNDQVPNIYQTAAAVETANDWEDVVSVRVGVLLRSANNISEIQQADTYTLLDTVQFTPATADKTLRYVVNSTIKPRNRGLTQSYMVCDADTSACNLL